MYSLQSVHPSPHETGETRQFLTFRLSGQEYGLDILSVREIRGWSGVTPLPNVPEYVRGVINLRGAIVPILDLRARFGLPSLEYGASTVVIVLRVNGLESSGLSEFGIVVDAVAEVYSIETDAIKATPKFGDRIDRNFVQGLATLKEKLIILLDIDRLLNHDDKRLIGEESQQLNDKKGEPKS